MNSFKNIGRMSSLTFNLALKCFIAPWLPRTKQIFTFLQQHISGLLIHSCSKSQVQEDSPPLATLVPWNWPTRPWLRLQIDYLGRFLGHMWLFWLLMHIPNRWKCSRCHLIPLVLLCNVYVMFLPDLACQIEFFLTMLQNLSMLKFHIFEAEWRETCNFST